MDAIIIDHPFGEMVISGKKKYDLRKTRTPPNKQGVPLFVISDGSVLGEVIIKCKYNQINHSYYWIFSVIKKYQNIKKVKQQSTQIGEWVSDVIVEL